eukprot:4746946-Alexandrium_andersonii.AAC.1
MRTGVGDARGLPVEPRGSGWRGPRACDALAGCATLEAAERRVWQGHIPDRPHLPVEGPASQRQGLVARALKRLPIRAVAVRSGHCVCHHRQGRPG